MALFALLTGFVAAKQTAPFVVGQRRLQHWTLLGAADHDREQRSMDDRN
ncbi:MAG: hypothetical protein ACI9XZ_004638 [Alphaproteobacteria bacterium]|jgi:hypothetical protein